MPTFETPDPISVTVDLGIGDVRIDASDRGDTTVEVRPRDPRKPSDVQAAEQTRVELADGHLLVKAPSGWRQLVSRRGDAIDVRIELPAGSQLRVDGGVASVEGHGRLGECRVSLGVGDARLERTGPADLKTGAGDVDVDRVDGRATIVTGTGAVRAGHVEGIAVVKNSNGDTWVGSVTADARIGSANGSIVVERALDSIVAKSSRGDVRIDEVSAGTVVAQSAMGSLEVGIAEGVSAWLELDTKFGEVRNDLDAADGPGAGERTVEVHASTSFGDITVRRAPSAHREAS